MLSWFLKKRGAAAAPPPAAPAQPKPVNPAPEVDWSARLAAAQGDDAALLQLAQTAAPLAVKLAAVQALVSEAALKQAERALRDRDRKLHRLAKQRHAEATTERESRATAQALLARATAWLAEQRLPVNHLVALDRDWEALPAQALTAGQREAFADLRGRLAAQVQADAETQRRAQRWTAEAGALLRGGDASLLTIAAQGSADEAGSLAEAAAALRASGPEAGASAELGQALAQLHAMAEQLRARLVGLDEPAGQPVWPEASQDAAPDAEPAAVPEPGAGAVPDPAQPQDGGGPALDQAVEQALAQRRQQALIARQPAAAPAPAAKPRPAPEQTGHQATRQRLDALLRQAESALAEGRLAEMQQQLQAIDAVLAKAPLAPGESWRARLQALRAERDRLKDWQQWGGSRVRDELMTEADMLARRVQPAADPASADMPEGLPVAQAPAVPKLNLKAHGDAIHALRQRWKALDHQGAAASAELWQRFDAALQIAHQPVAAQQAALKAARQDNLAAREALLAALEGLALPPAGPVGDAGSGPDADAGAEALPDWKTCQRELDQFNAAWRKLGPLEHTVPGAARAGLQQRLQQAVDRIEAPLQQARAAAAAEREGLVAAAQALAAADGDGQLPAEALRQVRALQADWAEHARRLPLPRALETALWARFKAATDAVYAQRDAVYSARDAERAALLAARQALLQRLAGLDAALPPAELARQLADIDREWRQQAQAPRGGGDALDRQFREARAAAGQRLDAARRQRWQAQVDALAARLAACELREAGEAHRGDAAAEDLEDATEAPLPPQELLPPAWAAALDQRLSRPACPGPLPAAEVDALLLRLEAALDLPAAPAWQAARQQLRLRTLKDTMEGRRAVQDGPADQRAWWSALLGQAGLDAAQRGRLQALLAALREAPAGALGTAIDAA